MIWLFKNKVKGFTIREIYKSWSIHRTKNIKIGSYEWDIDRIPVFKMRNEFKWNIEWWNNQFIKYSKEIKNCARPRNNIKNKKIKKCKIKSKKKIEYKRYLKSTEWKSKRNEFIKLHNSKCEICNIQQRNRDLHLHHHTYVRFKNERFEDLALVCNICHKNIHYDNWKRVAMNEKSLRKQFNKLKSG